MFYYFSWVESLGMEPVWSLYSKILCRRICPSLLPLQLDKDNWFSNFGVHQDYYLESLLKIQTPMPHSQNFYFISSGMWPKNILLIRFPVVIEQWFADISLRDPDCFRIWVETFPWLLLEMAHFEFSNVSLIDENNYIYWLFCLFGSHYWTIVRNKILLHCQF